jgi:hypothetical protein
MTPHEARSVLRSEFERIFKLPPLQAQIQLQQLFLTFRRLTDNDDLLDNLQSLVEDVSPDDWSSERRQLVLRTLRRMHF